MEPDYYNDYYEDGDWAASWSEWVEAVNVTEWKDTMDFIDSIKETTND